MKKKMPLPKAAPIPRGRPVASGKPTKQGRYVKKVVNLPLIQGGGLNSPRVAADNYYKVAHRGR